MLFDSGKSSRCVRSAAAVPPLLALGIILTTYKAFMWDTVLAPLLFRDDTNAAAVVVALVKATALHVVLVPFLACFRLCVVTHGGRVPDAYVRIMPGPHGDLWNAVMTRVRGGATEASVGKPRRSGRRGKAEGGTTSSRSGKGRASTSASEAAHGGGAEAQSVSASASASLRAGARGGSPSSTVVVAPTAAASAENASGKDGAPPPQPPLELRTVRFCQKCQVWMAHEHFMQAYLHANIFQRARVCSGEREPLPPTPHPHPSLPLSVSLSFSTAPHSKASLRKSTGCP